MITDLNEIKLLGKKREYENLRFRSFLKGIDDQIIDEIVHKLNDLYFKEYDCTSCGNCCQDLTPVINDNEVQAISDKVGVHVASFLRDFTNVDTWGERTLTASPCSFLMHNQCTIYEQRPSACREYPHLHKPGFSSRSLGAMASYSICPIVFNIIEDLKDVLEFRRGRG